MTDVLSTHADALWRTAEIAGKLEADYGFKFVPWNVTSKRGKPYFPKIAPDFDGWKTYPVSEWADKTWCYAVHAGESGLVVIDVDGKDGKSGWDSWEALCKKHGADTFPDTLTVESASTNSFHYYFTGSVPTSSSKLGMHIDVRSMNTDGGSAGLAFGPGTSFTDEPAHEPGSSYDLVNSKAPIVLPDWLRAEIMAPYDQKTSKKPGQAEWAGGYQTDYTNPDIDALLRDGIPAGADQDPILRDVVFNLVRDGIPDDYIETFWSIIVDKTEPTIPSDPFKRSDYRRHLSGAKKVLGRSGGRADGTGGKHLVVVNGEDIKIRAVEWLWQDRLPTGCLSLSAGRGDAGKSTHAAWLAAQVTKGTLPGFHFGQPKTVIWATLESSNEEEVGPRLVVAGADMTKFKSITVKDEDTGSIDIEIMDPEIIPALRDLVHSTNAALIVLDPLLDAMAADLSDKDQKSVRTLLGQINTFARAENISILGIAHFNKMSGTDALLKITGSAAFGQVVRSALSFAYNGEEKHTVMSQAKGNLADRSKLTNLTFTIEGVTIPAEGGKIADVGKLVWGAESEHSVDDILADKHIKKPMGKQAECDEWMLGYFEQFDQDGEGIGKDELFKAGHGAGFQDHHMNRSRGNLGIHTRRAKVVPGAGQSVSIWSLSSPEDEDSIAA